MRRMTDEDEEQDLAENIALTAKHEMPTDLARLRAFIDEGIDPPLTDEEFDRLLTVAGKRALRGESPEDWDREEFVAELES